MYADLVFVGGPVFLATGPQLADVAVQDDRILAIGQVKDLIGPQTEVVPIDGMLVPGVQDAHVHPVWGGLEMLRCELSWIEGVTGYRRAIAEYARAYPGRAWVTGGGWAMTAFPGGTPHRRDLDDIVPDRPVLLHNCDHHGAWVNTKALELAGIDATTPDPADGRIEREADGTPTGLLHEGAVALVTRHLPPESQAEYEAALRLGQKHLHRFGITGWQDAILGEYGGYRDPSPAYRALAASGELTARVTGALWWDRDRAAEQIEELVARRAENAIGRFGTPMVKIMLDGVAENFTASLTEPYLGDRGRGLSFVDYERLPEHVKALVRQGFSVHFHAIGDAAVRAALDAVAASEPGSNARHQIAHLQLVDPQDVKRFGSLGVIANMQPFWACHEPQLDTLAIPFLGAERASWLYPFGDLLRAGTPLAAGSDWPVSSADPWQGMHVAVNRAYHGDHVLLPAQRLDLMTALSAYTRGSAYANGCDEAGLIAPGYLADFVVLDRNPFQGEIRETRVLQTYVGGERVYDGG
ncbi:MAG TPA: amidohydrolase [Micromonosporaceae bacterium]|nr:amidohydrolase [Micromonosporaceae bacterium]HCU48423.1 amidohydrolase [Micromonosporaceae bacterium]